jgi:hypothetical protein
MSKRDEINEYTANVLAVMAGCAAPDNSETAGAKFLASVRDGAVEAWPRTEAGGGDEDRSDVAHEIADDAPDMYTHTRWLEFVDLCAYNEEPETDAWPANLTDAAAVALYQIADRLVHALFDELDLDADDASEDDDDE